MTKTYLLLLLVASGCASEPARAESAEPPTVVRVAAAERTRGSVVIEVVGTVRAVRTATIGSLIGGTVAEVRVGLGSSVRAGDVLVKLSAREIDARLDQTRAGLALARRERDRAVALGEERAMSEAQVDAALAQWSIARARHAEASSVAAHAVVRAPFAGVVTAKLASVGDTAMPGQALVILEAPGVLRFEARVPESAVDELAIGKSVPVRLDGLDRDLEGTVAEIQPASDDATRTRLVKVDLPTTPGLRSGRFGRLLLATGVSLAVSVPSEAVVRHGQLEAVFVVDSGSARLTLVRSGRERDGRLDIVAGLSGGETVVTGGAADLVDGQHVEVGR